MGPALAAALRAAGRPVLGPLGRGTLGDVRRAWSSCASPTREIAAAAAAIAPREDLLVGHCSGATGARRARPA